MATLQADMDMEKWGNRLGELTPQERSIVAQKATEAPFSGIYTTNKESGIYRCKVCNTPLFRSDDKFDSHCGWPSFDDAIPGAIKEQPDKDGRRTEILCAHCGAHLGHVFTGEGFTEKNTRHCVNSLSLSFEKKSTDKGLKEAYFAGGCFWGVEYYLEKMEGVKDVISGYMGGATKDPTYQEVCEGDTGHIESVKVIYDSSLISYKELAKHFFEVHDPTQVGRQGPDVGEQYISAVFVDDANERATIKELIGLLEKKGYKIATKIYDKTEFYEAEEYHQDYYERHKKEPYCHRIIKRFD
ncbi:MAG: bifunctional methionine sulfoxide reductase B/A protein [Sulfurovaceae bacterium]